MKIRTDDWRDRMTSREIVVKPLPRTRQILYFSLAHADSRGKKLTDSLLYAKRVADSLPSRMHLQTMRVPPHEREQKATYSSNKYLRNSMTAMKSSIFVLKSVKRKGEYFFI